MKRSVLRIVSVTLTLMLLAFTTSACGQQPEKAADSVQTTTTVNNAQTSASTETEAAKPIKFTIAVCQADYQKEFADLYLPAQEFTKQNPNITIEFMGTPHDEHKKKMDLMAQSNSLPDVFWNTFADVSEMVKMGVIADITEELKADADFSNSFITNAFNNFTFDGKVYGIPEKTDVMAFFYNKALLSKYNLTVPETWDELLNVIKVLNQNGITPFAQGTKDTWAVWGYDTLFDRYGWADFKPKFDAKQVKMVGSDMQKAFGRLQELAKAGAFPKNITTIDYTQEEQMFLGGKAAIYTTGSWQVADMNKSAIANDIDMNFGPTLPDGIADQKVGIKEMSNALWISAKTKQDTDKFKAVLAFFKYRASPEGTKMVVENANILPATKYSGDASLLGPVFNLVVKKLNDENKAVPQFCITLPASFMQPCWDAMTGVMNGLLTPEQACKLLDDWNETR